MAKKKKNANYVTEKNVQKQKEKEIEQQQKKRRETVKIVLLCVLAVVVLVGAVLGIGAACGMFDYYPEATGHAYVEIEGYGTLHIELYGNDAPKTVAHFEKLVKEGYYDGKTVYQLLDGMLYCGGQNTPGYGTVDGEFAENGVENKVSHKRGTLSYARDEDYNSANGRFFIVTEKNTELDGSYAAFGRIGDGMDIIDRIVKDAQADANGYLTNPPLITSVTVHEAH